MSATHFVRSVSSHIPAVLVFLGLAGVAIWGHRTGWKAPKFADLWGKAAEEETEDWCKLHNVKFSRCLSCHPELAGASASDWCKEHGVAESKCTLCHPELLTGGTAADWCREHGVPETSCNLCHPEIVVKGTPPTPENQTKVSLAPGVKPLKDPKTCQTHMLRVQFATPQSVRKAGIELGPVVQRSITPSIAVTGEIEYDKDRVVRLAGRVAGGVRRVDKSVGQIVSKGDVLAVLHSPEADRAKADFQRAVADVSALKVSVEAARAWAAAAALNQLVELHVQYLGARKDHDAARTIVEGYRRAGDGIPQIERTKAEQEFFKTAAAVNGLRARFAALGITTELLERLGDGKPAAPAEYVRELPAETRATLQSLGKPELLLERTQALALRENELARLRRELAILGFDDSEIEGISKTRTGTETAEAAAPSGGLFTVTAPFDGVIVERDVTAGEMVDASKTLFTIADTNAMWLMMDVRQEDARLVAKGQRVTFRPDGWGEEAVTGEIAWISTAADEKTRLVRVRANVRNTDARSLRANSFGNARIAVRESPKAVAVPNDSIQWEGCCWIVFVRLTDGKDDEIFQARKVNIGFRSGGFTEVIAGVSAGEVVAVRGSHVLKSEILKSNLGAGCCAEE